MCSGSLPQLVIFTSTMLGPSYVFAVEVAKAR
jgi:hypothetical protein